MPFTVSVVVVGGSLNEINRGDIIGAGSRPGRVRRKIQDPYPAFSREVGRVGTQRNRAINGSCDSEVLVVAGSHL